MECREVREFLPAYLEDGPATRPAEVTSHLASCSNCRTELEHYREMSLTMSSMNEHLMEPPAWLVGTLTETVVERAAELQRIRQLRRQVTDPKVVAGSALVAAGLVGALVMRGRRRRRRGFSRRVREALAQA